MFKCFQSQTSKIELFAKVFILDMRIGSGHASGIIPEWGGKSLEDTVKILFLQ